MPGEHCWELYRDRAIVKEVYRGPHAGCGALHSSSVYGVLCRKVGTFMLPIVAMAQAHVCCESRVTSFMPNLRMQMVVAYDPPPNVTLYIQSRGRARAEGSTYAWLRPKVQGRLQMEDKKDSLVR